MGQLKIKDNNDQWVAIPTGGVGVPDGGNDGDVLVKSGSADYATAWKSFEIVELLPTTASGLTSSASEDTIRAVLNLSDNINNYRFIQIMMLSTLNARDIWVSQMVTVPMYNGERISISDYSDNSLSYYCVTFCTLTGASLNVYRALFGGYTSPSFRVIGIK